MAAAAATDHKWLSATTALFEAVVVEGGRVEADSFLTACKNVPPIYDNIFSPGMVASTLKKDIDHHIAGVEGVRKRYPALRFLDELITKVHIEQSGPHEYPRFTTANAPCTSRRWQTSGGRRSATTGRAARTACCGSCGESGSRYQRRGR